MAKLRGYNKEATIKELQSAIISIRKVVDEKVSSRRIVCDGDELLNEIDEIILKHFDKVKK